MKADDKYCEQNCQGQYKTKISVFTAALLRMNNESLT